jgi:biopolymer transport protein ExbD
MKTVEVHSGPNMTPMVDVVMCILIFFMLGSSFLIPERMLESRLAAVGGVGPEAVLNAPLPAARFTLTLTRENGSTWISGSDGKVLQMGADASDATASYLAAKRDGLSESVEVIISPKGDVPYQDVVTVYDGCVSARFRQVAFGPVKLK